MNLPSSITSFLNERLPSPIISSSYIGGGDINDARHLKTVKDSFFVKYNNLPYSATMFKAEVAGLQLLKKYFPGKIPEVIIQGEAGKYAFLVLEYIRTGTKRKNFGHLFGHQLAQMHQTTAPNFGLNHSNFIGSLPQENSYHKNQIDFFIEERILPQMEMATKADKLGKTDMLHCEKLFKALPELMPSEPPALIHGDLWSGNYMVDENGNPALIDPSVSFGLREMDIGMSMLFGGFPPEFYGIYNEVYPLQSGFSKRIQILQLYYLLVHVNLFGSGYIQSVKRILAAF